MIRAMHNLICSAGHKHFSPWPETFYGRSCFYSWGMGDRRCDKPLRPHVVRSLPHEKR